MHHIHTWVTIIPPNIMDGKKSQSYRHYHQKAYVVADGTVKIHLTHDETEDGAALFHQIHTVQVTPMRKADKAVDVPHAAIHSISEDMKTLCINVVTGTMGHAHSMSIAPKGTCVYVTVMGENKMPEDRNKVDYPIHLINGVVNEIKE